MKKTLIFWIAAIMFILNSCGSFDISNPTLGGELSPMGEVGNSFSIGSITGVENTSATITEVIDGISTMEYSAKITDPILISLVEAMPDVVVTNGVASTQRKYRITTKGFQSVYDEGNLTIVNYDSSVGTKYSLKKGNQTITREVTEKSTTDDYAWGLWDIKVMKVEETGRNLPGVTKIEFIANHRWGMVGLKLYFEDGSEKMIPIYSIASN